MPRGQKGQKAPAKDAAENAGQKRKARPDADDPPDLSHPKVQALVQEVATAAAAEAVAKLLEKQKTTNKAKPKKKSAEPAGKRIVGLRLLDHLAWRLVGLLCQRGP